MKKRETVALLGNPNVGKSTIFNCLTGMHQHTGNWTGKTVEVAVGEMRVGEDRYDVVDLPGTYSLNPQSPEEAVTRDFILSGKADKIVVVCDAGVLERTLVLFLEVCEYCKGAILCVNLVDEARKKGIEIDGKRLSEETGAFVVCTSARQGDGISELKQYVKNSLPCVYNSQKNLLTEKQAEERIKEAEKVAQASSTRTRERKTKRDEALDRVLMGKLLAVPTMLLFLSFLIFITVFLANYPSRFLSSVFDCFEKGANSLFASLKVNGYVSDFICRGVLRTVGFVVSVMLPPMAIFFPVFTLMEDWGYLPRIAFNLDRPFCRCGTSGKQSLTMCMGLGCNAVGITGCRIIDSPRERKIGILTNSFMPCNGKFPTLIMISTVFFTAGLGYGILTSLIVTGAVVAGAFLTLFVSWVLSRVMAGEKGTLVLELPSYRAPKIGKTLLRSLLDRTAKVLARAIAVSAPAGALIWLASQLKVGDTSVLGCLSSALNVFAKPFGLDGVILLAFILGLPANEIIIPIAIMVYTSDGAISAVGSLETVGQTLATYGWNVKTALCVFILMLFHSPCLTSLWTVKKETGSFGYTALAALIPTVVGLFLCFLVNMIFAVVGY